MLYSMYLYIQRWSSCSYYTQLGNSLVKDGEFGKCRTKYLKNVEERKSHSIQIIKYRISAHSYTVPMFFEFVGCLLLLHVLHYFDRQIGCNEMYALLSTIMFYDNNNKQTLCRKT